MAVRKIVTIPDPILNKKCEIVKDFGPETQNLITDLLDTVYKAKDPEGAGLSANQIGVSKKICVVRKFKEDPANSENPESDDFVFVNPKIIKKSREKEHEIEGCLSVPDVYGIVERPKKIKVAAQNEKGENMQINASGFFARVIQHEVDHLNGILFTNKVAGKTYTEKELEDMYSRQENQNG